MIVQYKLELIRELALAKIELGRQGLDGNAQSHNETDFNYITEELNYLSEKFGQFAIFSVANFWGNICYVNDEFCRITGYTERELIGKNHRILDSGHHSQNFFQELWQTIHSGETWFGMIKNRSKNGCFFW